jgi:hypothetical protein
MTHISFFTVYLQEAQRTFELKTFVTGIAVNAVSAE